MFLNRVSAISDYCVCPLSSRPSFNFKCLGVDRMISWIFQIFGNVWQLHITRVSVAVAGFNT